MRKSELEKVLETVLERIAPGADERSKMERSVKNLETRVAAAARDSGLKVKVRVEGSVAKDTWLGEEPDIDVFMRVPKTVPRNSLGKVCLEIARKATKGSLQVERFAEHPYLEAFVDGTRVNVVPCYAVKQGEWLSATDRTPFHTDYVLGKLSKEMRDDVRLLKKFMKGVGVYGAEIKIGGFSGYLCELLVLRYESFVAVLEAFASFEHRKIVDIEGHYIDREDELNLLFEEPLVVVDPIDAGRNVASAVQKAKLYSFVAASRQFLETPKIEFFYPHETVALPVDGAKKTLKNRGSSILFLTFEKTDFVPDVLWGQLYKSQRSLHRLLALNDFVVLRAAAWSDEKTLNALVFELEQHVISRVKKHLGPPLERESESESFVKKHQHNANTVAGPYIEDGLWVAILKRKHIDAVELLCEKLEDGGKSAGVAEGLSHVLKKGFRVMVNDEIIDVYRKNGGFAKFLTEFLSGQPKWQEAN